MCGRFSLITNLSEIVESFHVQEIAWKDWTYKPENNVSPGQQIPAVIKDDKIRLVTFRWGLIPSWARDPSIGNRLINARAETLAVKPSFREAFRKRRCLIIADAFYEWQKLDRKKVPFHFSLTSGEPFGLAGLYELWLSPDGQTIKTCTIITTDANGLVNPIHDRMPAIIPKWKEALWLDPRVQDERALAALLKSYPSEEMKMREGLVIMFGDAAEFKGMIGKEGVSENLLSPTP